MLNQLPGLVAAVLAFCGMGFYVLCLWSVRTFLRDSRKPYPEFTPPVSILKPLRGVDPQMYESFASHCVQDYPDYEIIFGVNEADDPAVDAVHQLMCEFPSCRIKLVICPEVLGNNRKTSNLVQMLPHAQYGHIIINDSDIYVPPDYLRRVMAPFSRPQVGMVTCPYNGIAAPTLGSRLESIGISTDFFAGVLTARQIENGIHFALGSTLAMSRTALNAMGGLAPMVDYLADDFEAGNRIAKAGFEVVLIDLVVETHLPAYTFRQFFDHQMRWARSTRDSRRRGYVGLLLTFGLPWAIISVLLSAGAWWSWPVLALASLLRAAVAVQVGVRVVHDPSIVRRLWLIPLRDLIAFWVWFASFAGREVHWRGEVFILENGKIRPVHPSQPELVNEAEPGHDKVSVHW
ncbi:MAG TPA: bacteriohopanetetrol glucosamine biosynthesis glycosyltransferase HpnI [Candidatus Angelobacter sp.]|jgi:ceramide glucosyltransferase|nr:bacteriohopanetetrol glucosamine biosynthesis glycosyltransferase HpnI [Candidatus Angelobacter sp.]